MNDLKDKLAEYTKVGILGLGVTGECSFKFFNDANIPVIVWDDNKTSRKNFAAKFPDAKIINYTEGWDDCSHALISPGIPLYLPSPHNFISIAKKHNIKITSDIEVFYKLARKDAKFVAITGTNGKSTTSAMIDHILKTSNRKSILGGNIGVPVLKLDREADIYVIELSSYQLELLQDFRANVAVLLNITPDHLDRYGSMEKYMEAKKRIFLHQTEDDYAIIAVDTGPTAWVFEDGRLNHPSNFIAITSNAMDANSKNFVLYDELGNITDNFWRIYMKLENNIHIKGSHNYQNFTAAYCACRALGLDEYEIMNAANSFIGLPHRMEYVGRVNKINFYNDSKATNADAARPALIALSDIFWLAGGIPKEGGIEGLLDDLTNVQKAYLFGESAEEFAMTLKGKIVIEVFKDINSAFRKAYLDCLEYDNECNILLSPACSSFDQFKNFEERGKHFVKLFGNLSKVVNDGQ